jgi:hypothetical protein
MHHSLLLTLLLLSGTAAIDRWQCDLLRLHSR